VIELADIQSLVVRQNFRPTMTLHFFSLDSTRDMRRFLATAHRAVTSAADADRGTGSGAINVGISAAGLRLAQIPARAYDALSPAFTAGMRAASGRLSDVGASDPGHWNAPFDDPDNDIHAVVIALGDPDLATFGIATPGSGAPSEGFEAAFSPLAPAWHGAARPGGKEPFGFRDNISDPVIEGSGAILTPGNGVWDQALGQWRPVRAGEAVLGYTDESGLIAGHPDAAQVERNGSYLVIRKLEQFVDEFQRECERWANVELCGRLTPDEVAARMVGRNQDGTVLGATPGRDPNDFRYRDGSAVGREVMPSAHIRRANPRDGIAASDAIVPRHQLFRRGMPYREEAGDGEPTREGLLFLACCADLRRQFEFVQSHWVQDGLRFGLGHERDPLLGERDTTTVEPESRYASISDADGRRSRLQISTFVATRGGEYFLLPGRTALDHLATAPHAGVRRWT
jgi:Dyp-type peroxidase family